MCVMYFIDLFNFYKDENICDWLFAFLRTNTVLLKRVYSNEK